jgi:hypothetical protein
MGAGAAIGGAPQGCAGDAGIAVGVFQAAAGIVGAGFQAAVATAGGIMAGEA